jgi:acyl carrier protein
MLIDEFRQMIADISKVPVNQIQKHSSLRDELGIDSLQMVNLIVEITQRTGFELNRIESFNEIQTVGSMYHVLYGRGENQ